MFSLCIAFCLSQSAVKDVHILATPLEKAVAQLSQIYNSPMDISTLLKGKVILIDATQVSESEVRDQIAKTINATWEKKGDTWHLTKTAKEQNEDVQRGVNMRLRFLKKTYEMRDASLKEKPTFDNTLAMQTYHQLKNEAEKADSESMGRPGPSAAGYRLPGQRFLSRFLLKFGLDRIAAIPTGQRAVFSLHPNAMQKSIGVDLSDELEAFRKEQTQWLTSATPLLTNKETAVQRKDVRVLRSSEDDDSMDDLMGSFSIFPTELKDAMFTVYCSEDGGHHMKLFLYPVAPDHPTISMKATSYEGAFAGLEGTDLEVKPVEGFKLSQDSADFQQFFLQQADLIPADRREVVLNKLADPVTKDFLAYGLGESIVFDTRRLKKNIVALLSDSQLNIFEPIFGDFYFNEKFKNISQDFVSMDDRWIRMLEMPFSEPNFPRMDLKNLIARVRGNRRVNIMDRAALAAIRPRTQAVSYVERLLEKFAGSGGGEYCDSDALKAVGMLSQSEYQAAVGPNGVRYSQLNSGLQRHLFECCYFNQSNRVWFVDPNRQPRGNSRDEPTLLAPNGIESASVLRITEHNEDEIKDPDNGNNVNLQTNAKGWGSTMYQIDHPEEYPGSNFKFDRTRKLYRLRKTSYDLKLQINAECQWQAVLQSSERVGSDMFTIENLPEDMKKDFEAGYKEAADGAKLRRERLKAKGGGGTLPAK